MQCLQCAPDKLLLGGCSNQMGAEKREFHCSPMHLSVSGVMKGRLFHPGGGLGAVITRLLCSPGLAQRCGGDAKQM